MDANARAGQARPAGGSSCAYSTASDQVATSDSGQPSMAAGGLLRRRCPYSARYSRQVLSATAMTAPAPAPAPRAGPPGPRDARARLRHRERQRLDVLGQVERLDPLVGEADQPGIEVADGLPPAQPGDAVDGPAC